MTRPDPTTSSRQRHIQDVFARLPDDKVAEASSNLDEYLEVVLRIYERIASKPDAYAELVRLTTNRRNDSMEIPNVSDLRLR